MKLYYYKPSVFLLFAKYIFLKVKEFANRHRHIILSPSNLIKWCLFWSVNSLGGIKSYID